MKKIFIIITLMAFGFVVKSIPCLGNTINGQGRQEIAENAEGDEKIPSLTVYVGHFKEGKWHGHGTCTTFNYNNVKLEEIKGIWVHGFPLKSSSGNCQNGQGSMMLANLRMVVLMDKGHLIMAVMGLNILVNFEMVIITGGVYILHMTINMKVSGEMVYL